MRSATRKASLARGPAVGPSGFHILRFPCGDSGTNGPVRGSAGYLDTSLKRGLISMGSIRTWSLALIAGIFVVVVAHQRSNADAGLAGAAPAAAPPAVTSAPVS